MYVAGEEIKFTRRLHKKFIQSKGKPHFIKQLLFYSDCRFYVRRTGPVIGIKPRPAPPETGDESLVEVVIDVVFKALLFNADWKLFGADGADWALEVCLDVFGHRCDGCVVVKHFAARRTAFLRFPGCIYKPETG